MIKKMMSEWQKFEDTLPSVTEPNQSLTIRQIIDRFIHGIIPTPNIASFDECDDDEFEDDPTRSPGFEFSDAHELALDFAQSNSQTSDSEVGEERAPSNAMSEQDNSSVVTDNDQD